jgi:D-alanyl-D-alanine carboxypeptidase
MKNNILIPITGMLCIVLGVSLLIFVIGASANTSIDETEHNKTESTVASESSENTNDKSLLKTEDQNQQYTSETVAEEPEIKDEIQISDETLITESSAAQQDHALTNNTVVESSDSELSVQDNNSEETSFAESTEAENTAINEVTQEEYNSETDVVPENEPKEQAVYFDGTTKVDTSLWNLILVNPDNYIPENFTIDKAQVQGNYYLDSRVAPLAVQMISDAKKEGIELQICSSIRDIELQKRLFNNKINDLINEGYSKEEAERVAATIVAVPGTSEHHTGLAMDIVTPSYQRLNSGYAKTDAAKWLKANAANYGFILRYPEDKTDITKIIFEPWHYRYVGIEYASFIMSQGICFEEFIELYGESKQ